MEFKIIQISMRRRWSKIGSEKFQDQNTRTNSAELYRSLCELIVISILRRYLF